MEKSKNKESLLWLWIVGGVLIILSLFLSKNSFGRSDDYYKDLSARERSAARKVIEEYLGSRSDRALRIKGDTEIDRNEHIRADVIFLQGTLQVRGQVDGDVVVLFGDVELGSSARVDGDIILLEGKIWQNSGAIVSGDIIKVKSPSGERSITRRDRREERPSSRQKSHRHEFDSYLPWENEQNTAYIDYNRVDGFTLGLQIPSSRWFDRRGYNFALIGKGGYAFARKKWLYQLGLERWIFDHNRFTIGAELHNFTDTQDHWIINGLENSLAASLIKEDFRDYYSREGFSAYIAQNLSRHIKLTAEYHEDDFSNLENNTSWSLFGGKKHFRPNPLAVPVAHVATENGLEMLNNPLNIKSAVATLTIDTRNKLRNTSRGWYITAFAERAGHELNSGLDFERFILDIRRFQPLGWDENLNFRLRAGTSTGLLPPMYWFDLGGISTLRGFRFKEMTGNRMVLGNLEYRIRTHRMDWPILDSFDVILFVDSGYAWFTSPDYPQHLLQLPIDPAFRDRVNKTYPKDTFDDLTWSSLKTNVGIGLASHDDGFRVDFAKRTDIAGKDIVVTLRLYQSF